MSPSHPTTSPSPVKRPRGRPNAQRPARINTRISKAAADQLQLIRQHHPGSLASTLETLIMQFPVEINKEPDTMNKPS